MKKSAILLFVVIPLSLIGQHSPTVRPASAGDIIQSIIRQTGAAIIPNTVDVIKEGDPSTPVTGIITCMFATMDVLKEAVDKSCNLIITHEPIYFNHLDETDQLKNDPVFLAKKKYINDHRLVIWRFHDYIHSMHPDGINSGMVEKLGWKGFAVNQNLDRFTFPGMTLDELLAELKKSLPGNAFYVIGKPGMKVKNVALAAGAPGFGDHLRLLEDKNVDVLISGEAQQWETYEYVREADLQGVNKAVIFLGHIPSEESGMVFCAGWLKTFIKDIPISYAECGPSYRSF